MSLYVSFTGKDIEQSVRRHYTSEDGPISQLLRQRANKVVRAARFYVSVESRNSSSHPTGELSDSIHATTVQRDSGGRMSVRVGSDLYYARWVHDGTGIYGPSHSPIVARGRSMVFTTDRGTIFATRVRGQRGKLYLTKAMSYFRNVGFTDEANFAEDIVNYGL